MLVRILELRHTVRALSESAKEGFEESEESFSSLQKVLLCEADYAKIAILVHLLDPLAYVSEILQASQCATVSQIYPLIKTLLDIYEEPVEDEAIDHIRKEIVEDLKERWGSPSEAHMIACFLDPRFKCLSFVEESQRDNLVHRIRELCMQERASKGCQEQAVVSDDVPSGGGSSIRKHTYLYFNRASNAPKRLKRQEEVDLYLEMPQVEECVTDFDVLAWWKTNEKQLPFLSVLSRKYMCRMPSTASIEGIFSMTGNILGINRTRLGADMLNDILVLKKFYSEGRL